MKHTTYIGLNAVVLIAMAQTLFASHPLLAGVIIGCAAASFVILLAEMRCGVSEENQEWLPLSLQLIGFFIGTALIIGQYSQWLSWLYIAAVVFATGGYGAFIYRRLRAGRESDRSK